MALKEYQITSTIYEFDNPIECPDYAQNLITKAKQAREKAYAPYSKFLVGAALLLDNGEIITGNNQENASYPSGLCAERTAIYYAGSQFPDAKVKSIAICAGLENKENHNPAPPCGACRQAIAEYEQKQNSPIEIYFTGTVGKVKMVKSLLSLLPFSFDKGFLDEKSK
jgi:cytidine deaminase